MSVPIDNNLSVKKYYKISKYKEVEIEIEKKCGPLKPKKETETHKQNIWQSQFLWKKK